MLESLISFSKRNPTSISGNHDKNLNLIYTLGAVNGSKNGLQKCEKARQYKGKAGFRT